MYSMYTENLRAFKYFVYREGVDAKRALSAVIYGHLMLPIVKTIQRLHPDLLHQSTKTFSRRRALNLVCFY